MNPIEQKLNQLTSLLEPKVTDSEKNTFASIFSNNLGDEMDLAIAALELRNMALHHSRINFFNPHRLLVAV